MLQAILQYQETDAKLYKLEREIAGCEERKEYVKFKKFLEAAPEKLDALEVKAAALQSEAAEITQKYTRAEEALGDFENLDELVTSGADIAFYKKKAQALVDQLKKLKADLAALTANIKATDEEYKKLKKQVLSAQKQYADATEKYQAVTAAREPEKKALEEELSKLEKGVPAEMLETYRTKRKEKIFPIVGQISGTCCPYCSMDLPIALRSKLSGGAWIECENHICNRILFG